MRHRLAVLLPLSILMAAPFFAQGVEAISISPLTFELFANPGDRVENIIRVTNDASYPIGVTMNVEDFTAVGEEGQVVLESSDNNTYSLAKWVTVSENVFELAPGETKTIQFRADVPPNAEPGGHYGSILATISANAQVNGGTAVAQRVGSLLLMNVSGDVNERLRVVEFSAPRFSEYGPVNVLARFENSGTVHLKPRGFILVKDMLGRETAKIELPQKNVLPRSIRRVETPTGEKYMFGRYEATLTAIYGSTNEPVSATTVFWVIPWKIASALGLAAIALLIFLIKGRGRIRMAIKILLRGNS